MTMLIKLLHELKETINLFLGWLELVLKPSDDKEYQYVMDRIDVRERHNKLQSIIYYKLIGCRKLLYGSADELNKKTLFALFRSDHAQMIISIATAEALLDHSTEEMRDKYKKYVSFCNLKLNEKK
ncbi:MAG: hypothetical protein K0R24_354 [Gammaproteobacteria bacterium]|nr:hypothetical protein [Gammaproteobacteria bacterium]